MPASASWRLDANGLVHNSFTMIGATSRDCENSQRESAPRDSRKKPVLASGDETRSRRA
jgi:hypothetical protein